MDHGSRARPRHFTAHCPEAPGIGAQIDFDLIARKKIAVLS